MEVSSIVVYLFIFIVGASVGSFLNVLADRLPRGEQVFKGRSYCNHCKHQLSWRDLFPIFSWLALRGHCRFCHSLISGQYPIVELSTGILFMAAFLLSPWQNHELGNWIGMIYTIWLISALIVIFVTDLKHQIIPDQVVFPTIIFILLYQILDSKFLILNSIFSAAAAGLFFFVLVLATSGRGMGWGDVKLAFLMGLVLGFPKIIVALYLAFLTGAFWGVILILVGKKRFGEHIPFGPFLSGATFVSLFWGQNLWQFFQKIIGLP